MRIVFCPKNTAALPAGLVRATLKDVVAIHAWLPAGIITVSRLVSVALLLLGSSLNAQAQAIQCSAFLHNGDGSWRSFQTTTVIGSHGKVAIESGEIFKRNGPKEKADIATILDGLCG